MQWSQQGSADEQVTNISVPQQEGQADATGGKVIADYDLDMKYEAEVSGPEIEAVDKEEEDSDALTGCPTKGSRFQS